MSHFYGTLKGARGEATRCGSDALVTHAAGWRGAVRVELTRDGDRDCYRVSLVPWQGSGGAPRVLAAGVLDTQADGAERQQTVLEALEALRVAAEGRA